MTDECPRAGSRRAQCAMEALSVLLVWRRSVVPLALALALLALICAGSR